MTRARVQPAADLELTMTRTDLDTLVKALEAAVSTAQSNMNRQQQSALRYRIEQQDGRISAINYALCVRAGREVNGRADMIEIPLCSLRANTMFQVSQVSLQFETKYQAPDNRRAGTAAHREIPKRSRFQRVLKWLCAWPKPGRPARARIDIQCTGNEPMTSELRIDGKLQNRQRPDDARFDSSYTP
jgi:hypothetical protein